VVPKVVTSSLPVVIKESTISHDENDPTYDAALAASYCARSRVGSVDEDTDSASEEDYMSNSESSPDDDPIISNESFTNNDQRILSVSSHYRLISTSHSVTSSMYATTVPSLSRSYPGNATLWKENRNSSPSVSSSDSLIKVSPKVGSIAVEDFGFSGLSQDTLRLLGINTVSKQKIQNISCRNAAVFTEKLTAGGDDMLLSMAQRLNEAAARSSQSKSKLSSENSSKNVGTGDGCCPTDSHLECAAGHTSDDDPLKTNQSAVPVNDKQYHSNTLAGGSGIANGIEFPVSGNIALPLKYSLSIVPKQMASLSKLSSNADGLSRIDQTDGPPYETDQEQEDSNALHLVAEFSSEDESLAQSTNNSKENGQVLCSAVISNAADFCGPSASGETSKIISDGVDKQEKCQVVLHDVLKLGLALHDGVCHLKSEVDDVSNINVLSKTSHNELSDTVNGIDVCTIEIPKDIDINCVDAIDSTISKKSSINHIVVKSSSAHTQSISDAVHQGICDITVSSSEVLLRMSSGVIGEIKNVNTLIADIVPCVQTEGKSVAVNMNDYVSQKHQFSESSQSSASSSISTYATGSTAQKINCVKIPRLSSTNVVTSTVQSPSVISSGSAILSITHSAFDTSQITKPKSRVPSISRSSKVASLKNSRVTGLQSSALQLSSHNKQLTLKQAPVVPDASVQLSSLQRQGGQVFLTSTESTSNSSHSVLPCVTHVPLTSTALQAGVRPVCPAPVATGTSTSSTICDGNTSPQVETLQQLLASARHSKPFFIHVSTAEQTTSKPVSSFEGLEISQQHAAIGMQQNLKVLNSTVDNRVGLSPTGNVLSTVENVAVSQSRNTRLTKFESSRHKMKPYVRAADKRAYGSTVLTDASNQPLLKRKYRVKLKDLNSPHAKAGQFRFPFC